jgi:hypothetical protein
VTTLDFEGIDIELSALVMYASDCPDIALKRLTGKEIKIEKEGTLLGHQTKTFSYVMQDLLFTQIVFLQVTVRWCRKRRARRGNN